jgi:hypothetical protein
LDAYPQRRFTGTVKDVLKSAEKRRNWGKAHYFNAVIHLDSRDATIMKPGMSVKGIIKVTHYKEALLVPLKMVSYDGQFFKIKPKGTPPSQSLPLV